MKSRLLTALLCSPILACGLALAKDRTVSISGHKITIAVPAGYSFESKRNEEGNTVVAMENPVWGIAVTAFLIAESDPKALTPEWQQNQLVTLMADGLAQSAEKDYRFKPLKPLAGTGTYCVFTDSVLKKGQTLPPGEYIHMTGGVKAWRGCVVAFTIMSNDLSSDEYREIFELFRSSFTGS